MSLPPLRFEPILKERVWGGRRLEALGRRLPAGVPVGESWELSDRPDARSVVAEGPFKGRTLADLLEEHGEALAPRPFPLLVKHLDAQSWLSLQVHPLPGTAAAGESSKTEAWYVLEAAPGSEVLLGLAEGKTPDDLARALAEGAPERVLRRHPVRAGDAVLVPAGAVHAIGPGVLLAEVQENADTTYRLHDWGRNGPAARALQPEAAMRTLRAARAGVLPPRPLDTPLSCPGFRLSRSVLDGRSERGPMGGRFGVLGVAEGDCGLRWGQGSARMPRGSWWLLPASLGSHTIEGKAVLLEVHP